MSNTCDICYRKRLPGSNVCDKHYFEQYANVYLPSLDTDKAVKILKRKWETHIYCPYTAEKLELSINEQLDYIIPRDRIHQFGIELEDPDNLEFISRNAPEDFDKRIRLDSSQLATIKFKKWCPQCTSFIDKENFIKQKSSLDGLRNHCKRCEEPKKTARRDKKKSLGECLRCSEGALANSSLCEYHYLEGYASKYLRNMHKREGVLYLKNKLIKQNRKCPYTDEPLTLGLNTHLDHIIPQSRVNEFGIDIYDHENVEWVSKRANISKSDMTKDEFILFCTMVAKKFAML